MLETEYQNETAYAEAAELSPVDQLRQQWINQPGPIPLWKQKNIIEQNAELVPYAGTASISGWSWPYAFAFQGLVIVAIAASLFNWYVTRDSGKLHDEILNMQATTQAELKRQHEIIDATEAEIRRITKSPKDTFKLHMSEVTLTREQALQELNASLDDSRKSAEQYKQRMELKEREKRATQNARAIANSGAPLFFSLALVLAAGGVRRGVQKDYARSRQARNSGDFYLYFATSEGMLLNLAFLAFFHFALSGSDYGLDEMFQRVGPLFWVLFWIGSYALALRYFVGISRGMYKALQLRPPVNEWGPENRMLLRIHNSFLLIFVFLEGTFLSACYLIYHADKRLF